MMKSQRPPTKHQLKSEATRVALLKAAEKIFARDGYERAQIDEIAKLSGRTRGAVYSQYKTKEQLFFALQEQRIRTAVVKMEAALVKVHGNPDAGLAALREFYADLRDAETAILDIELKLYAIRNPECQEEWREHYAEMYPTGEFSARFGVSEQRGRSRLRSRLLALTVVKSSLVLAMRFMPGEFTSKEVKLLLKEVFDGLFTSADRSSSSESKAPAGSRK